MNRLPSAGTDTKVGLHFEAVARIVNAPTVADAELVARGFVAERLSLETFQRPDDIARGLAMVGISKAWSAAFPFRAPALYNYTSACCVTEKPDRPSVRCGSPYARTSHTVDLR